MRWLDVVEIRWYHIAVLLSVGGEKWAQCQYNVLASAAGLRDGALLRPNSPCIFNHECKGFSLGNFNTAVPETRAPFRYALQDVEPWPASPRRHHDASGRIAAESRHEVGQNVTNRPKTSIARV